MRKVPCPLLRSRHIDHPTYCNGKRGFDDTSRFVFPRQDTTNLIKYMLIVSNSMFWLAGLAVIFIGMYAWAEKDTFRNIGKLVAQRALFFDPAFLFVVGGCFILTVSFLGCFGALRESQCSLLLYTLVLTSLFAGQMSVAIYTIVNRGSTGDLLSTRLFDLLDHYRDDDDLKNLVDWIQGDWLACCGVNSFRDWQRNSHFKCKIELDGSLEACSVPSSCCKRIPGLESAESNSPIAVPFVAARNRTARVQCGHGVLRPNADLSLINVTGCLQNAYVWIVKHSSRLALVAACLLLIQVLGVALAMGLRSKIADKKIWTKIGLINESDETAKR